MKDTNADVIKAVFDRIGSTTSRKEKEEIIASFHDNDTILEAFYFLFNPFIHTGISRTKIKKTINVQKDTTLTTPKQVFDYLEKYDTGRDVDIKNVQEYIESAVDKTDNGIDRDEQRFLNSLFTKTLKIGVTASTVNKALGYKFIPEFKVQLSHSFDKYKNSIPAEFTITEKLDGHRTLCVVDDMGFVDFFTRKGNDVLRLTQIEDSVKNWVGKTNILGRTTFNSGVVLDGEIIVQKGETDDLFNETSKIIRKNGEKTGLVFHVFDIIPREVFLSNDMSKPLPYSERRKTLNSLFAIADDQEWLKLVPALYSGSDTEQIEKIAHDLIEEGKEGAMVNDNSANYQFGRTKSLLKVKEFHSADLVVTGYFEGQGKYEGTLGGLIVDYNGNEVKVGSGFTDEQRDEYWAKRDEMINRIVQIDFFSESTNQNNDEISLRFPTIKGIREDKDEKDVNID